MIAATKKRLIKEYITLAKESPTPAIVKQLDSLTDSDDFYEWQKTGDPDFPLKLKRIDPFGFGFGIPETNTNFGPKAKANEAVYNKTPVDVKGLPQGDVVDEIPISITHIRALKEILNPKDKEKLLINHDSGDFNSTKNVLDGFGIDRLIECYAEGMTDEVISNYLKIRPSQLKRWITVSPQRVMLIQRLQDIMRSQNINTIIGEALNYEIGEVLDRADAAFESLRMDAMKMKSKAALDLDARARIKDQGSGESLPVVNLGLQINIGADDAAVGLSKATAVIPTIISSSD